MLDNKIKYDIENQGSDSMKGLLYTIEKEKHNEKDLKEIYEEGKDEEIKCHFCNTKYVFTKEQIGELLTKIK